MFGHLKRQEEACQERTEKSAVHPGSNHTGGYRRISSTLALPAVTAMMLLSSCGGSVVVQTSSTSTTSAHLSQPSAKDQQGDLEHLLFTLINNHRATQGLAPYTWDNTLAKGARAHSMLMAQGCGLQHQCPGEPDIGRRVTAEGIQWMAVAENIGEASYPVASDGVTAIDKGMFDEGPGGGHYDNMMSNTLRNGGIGIVIDDKGTVWATEDFDKLL